MFATRFWSNNYEEGLDTLFGKLNQGIVENQELLAVAKARADAEAAHGTKLESIASTLTPKKNGFGKDDGATMRKAFEGILQQFDDEARQHAHIASSIKSMVIDPFTKWSSAHQNRITVSQTELQRLLKVYNGDLQSMTRAQHRYFNRCRLDEDNVEDAENSSASSPEESETSSTPEKQGINPPKTRSVSGASNGNTSTSTSAFAPGDSTPTSEELVMGGKHYSAEESQELVKRMLNEIPQSSTYVKILGTYDHTVTGAQLTTWLTENTGANNLALAEEAGQMLVNRGFMRLVGQMGSRFVNSSVFTYQWKPKAWEFAGMAASFTTFTDLAERWARNTVAAGGDVRGVSNNEDGPSVRELDQKYRKSVDALEHARLDLEATMIEHFNYLEKCERERLVAFKAVLLDFAAAISNIVPALSAGVDKLLLYQETANVDRDLRFLVENYQTGKYSPRVFVYDNYYSSTDGAAIFGLDLELRARADKKKVPLVVGQILGSLDSKYPKMVDDAERLALWKRPLHYDIRLAQSARQKLNSLNLHNTGASSVKLKETFDELSPLALVQVLKLYFLELPISVVGGQLYDILKGIYSRYSTDRDARLQALQNTLGQLTVTHIATLDALTSHIHRLITIANANEDDVTSIANEWGSALCRPKSESMLAINDAFPALILTDLLHDRDRLFGELKRQQSSRSVSSRKLRQVSTPEVGKLVLNSDRPTERVGRETSAPANAAAAASGVSFSPSPSVSSAPVSSATIPSAPVAPPHQTVRSRAGSSAAQSVVNLRDKRPTELNLSQSEAESDAFEDAPSSNSPGIATHPSILPSQQ